MKKVVKIFSIFTVHTYIIQMTSMYLHKLFARYPSASVNKNQNVYRSISFMIYQQDQIYRFNTTSFTSIFSYHLQLICSKTWTFSCNLLSPKRWCQEISSWRGCSMKIYFSLKYNETSRETCNIFVFF